MVSWRNWLTRLPFTQKIAGSSPAGTTMHVDFKVLDNYDV